MELLGIDIYEDSVLGEIFIWYYGLTNLTAKQGER